MSDERSQGRVAVLVTGYGEPEDHDSFRAWNELSFRHLVRKFARIPERLIPFLAGVAERRVRREWIKADGFTDRKSTRLNSSHSQQSRMPSSA